LLQTKHWRDWRNVLCILLIGLCASCAWAQAKAVGPVRLSINPPSPAPIPNGKSLKLTVTEGFFKNIALLTGTHDTSSDVIWISDNPSVISVGSHGLAIAHLASGTANITAKSGPARTTIQLTAAPAVLQFIVVSPFDSSVAVSGNRTYMATGHYSDSTTADLTGSVTWAVVNNINGTGGQATNAGPTVTATAAGIVKVTATDTSVTPNITGATYLNVGLTAITVSPTNPSVPKGKTQQFTATGTFGATPHDVTNSVFWISQTTTVAKITSGLPACGICPSGGIASTFAVGTSGIYAISGGVSSAVPAQTLTVTAPVVTSVTIAPSGCNPANVPRGNSCQFVAEAIYSDQTTATVTDSATWNSDNTSCATVNATGLATTLSSIPNPCIANVTATFSVLSNSIALMVTAHVLNSISVSPARPTQPKGSTQQFTVKAHYSDGIVTVINGGGGPSWSSTNSSVATIDSLGLATAMAQGTATIKASYSGLNASTSFTVTAVALISIAVSPAPGYLAPTPVQPNTTIPVAGSVQLQAIGTYSDNSTQDLTTSATWSSDNTGVATVSSSDPTQGVASGMAPGTANITAAFGSVTSPTSPLTVKTITSIAVNPAAPPAINPGQQQPFAATINYGSGVTQDLTQFDPVWGSSANNVATVDQTGLATAVSGGSATITATLGSVSCPSGGGNCGVLTVNPAVLQSITVSCDPNNPCTGSGQPLLSLGQTEQMIATGNYSNGSTQDLTQDPHLTWGPSSGSVATVDTTGFLTTKGLGSTNITAVCSSMCPGATSTVTGTLPLTVTF